MMEKQRWEKLLEEAMQLVAPTTVSVFDRIVKLAEIWGESQFWDRYEGDYYAAENCLNTVLLDFGLSVLDGFMLVRNFPERDSWVDCRLREMLATAAEKDYAATYEIFTKRRLKNV